MYGICSDLGGDWRAASLQLKFCLVFLWSWVSGFEMGRREHTIDGAIAINCMYDTLDGGRAFLPLASCCSLSSLASHLPCLRCFVLEIGWQRLQGLYHHLCLCCCCWSWCHGGFVWQVAGPHSTLAVCVSWQWIWWMLSIWVWGA